MLWSPKILTKIECSGAKFSPGHNFGVNSKKWPKKIPRDALFPVRSRLAVARGASYCWLSECTSAPAAFCLLLFWDTQHGVYLTSWLPYSADSLWLGFVSWVGGGTLLKGVVKCLEPPCGREKTSGDNFFAKYTWFAHINESHAKKLCPKK